MNSARIQQSDYTVVIPAWNAADTIAETLRSIAAQSVSAAEIILVDDGSTDGTLDVAAASGVPFRPVKQDVQEGPGAATTSGMRLATTNHLAFLDADDLWLPDKMERQLTHLADTPGAGGVFGHWQTFRDNPEKSRGQERPGWSRTTFVVRRDIAYDVGPMIDLPGRVGDMIDWITRARERGYRFDMIPEVVALRRIRAGSLSDALSNADRNRGYVAAARNALLRRKGVKAGG